MGIVENTYAELKQQELKNNPYSCLHMADIDINPHQVEAFTFALSSLELGGAILADEVGLGKTIEAGLVIKYLLCSGKNKILLIMPSNLRKQWQVELEEKFDIDSLIVDSSNWEDYLAKVKSKQAVIIVSYHFASKRKTEFGKIAWDFCVFDEAHRLRNVYKNGSKMANSLYELTKTIPKILLTATPMQNTLLDIYGLVQFIDDRVFYSKQIFSERYLRGEDYNDLKACLESIVQRTLRKEVAEYIQFSERKEMTIDFELSPMEIELYVMINNYLKKEILYALPNSHRTLMFIKKVEELKKVAISVPKIGISYSSTITFKSFTVKRNIMDFDVAASRIERYDAVNGKLLQVLDADALIVENPENMLAVSLLESIPEFSSDDAEFILEVVDQYLALIEGTDEEKKKIVRRYATVIVEDLRKQIYASKEESTEFVFNVQKDLIVFKSFAKNMKENGRLNFKKEVPDKKNIKQYLFEGYKKSYYAENAFDSDDERRLSVVLEEDSEVIRFIKPPLNQLGLFYKAAKQYNPDFLVETADKKYMIEVKAANQTDNEDVQEKAKAAIKWCECASQVDADGKTWEYRLVPGDKIIVGNTFKYVIGMAIPVVVDGE